MKAEIFSVAKLYREKFHWEEFTPSDNLFMLVKSGSFKFSQNETEYTVAKNEGAFMKSGVFCKRKVIEPITVFYFRFRSDTPIFEGGKVCFPDANRVRANIDIMDRCVESAKKKEIYEHILYDLFFQQLIYTEANILKPNGKNDKLIDDIILSLENEMEKRIPLTYYAKANGLSYVQFARRFKAKVGISPLDYMQKIRHSRAKELLSNTNLLVKEISVMCGYENEYYFSKAFKKFTECSPTYYRASKKDEIHA